MRSGQEIVHWIDEYYSHLLARPEMYARGFEEFDGIVHVLETIRSFIHSSDPDHSLDPFTQYLMNNDYDGLNIRLREEVGDSKRQATDPAVLKAFAKVVERFLKQAGRM